MFNNIGVVGLQPKAELSITQFAIPAGAGATFSAANNIGTITFNAAHGLTMAPAAGVPANMYITFGGSTSGLTGTGILVGNIFRILTIPSTTAITIYTTITAATVTSLTGIPVFFPNFLQAAVAGSGSGSPTQTISSVVTAEPFANLGASAFYATTGANARVRYNPAGTALALDASTGNTPATAPTWRDLIPVSSQGLAIGAFPYLAVWADGSTATSYLSVVD